ncbi:MAG: MFS transporter [Prevotellaceae bacterium]|jgi:fucose permease|nr:MFS transporter [Prevotellaceae bacterium]
MYKRSLVFIAACAGLAFFGVTMFALGPVLKQLGEGANALPATLSVGIILGTVLFGPVVDRFGYKWLLICGAFLAIAGIQGLANYKDMTLLHISMFMLGFGGGILNGETNALVAEIYDDSKRGARLSILGAFYCIGALLWTLLNYFITDYAIPLHCISCIMFVAVILFIAIQFPKAKPKDSVSLYKSLRLLKYPSLILFALILFFQSGFEGISGNFTVKFLGEMHETPNNTATLSLTWFTTGMFIGRIPLGLIMKKLNDSATLYLYLSIAVIGVVFLYFNTGVVFLHFAENTAVVYLSTALIGFGVGATYPVVFNYLGSTFKELSGTAFSIAIFIGLLGQFTFNRIAGIFFDRGDFACFPFALAFAVVMMMVILPAAKSKTKIKK